MIEDKVGAVSYSVRIKRWKVEDIIKSEKPIERTIKMNFKWVRLLTAVFLSAIMLMGCNNVEDDNNPPPEVDVG
ncbi:TPA: hypothetical protein VJS58_001813, partial [Streptococcus pyogenes]|nr:hypothetical protein [Streptococcus pyogenes]